MNKPNSLPSSVIDADDEPRPRNGIGSRFGNIAREAAPTLGNYVNIIRARKWMILALTALITVLAAVVVNLMTPIYRATATLLIENTKSKMFSFEELYGVPAGSREFFQTQAEFMKSREVGMRVVQRMNLLTNPEFDPRQVQPGVVKEWIQKIPGLAPTSSAEANPEARGNGPGGLYADRTDDEIAELVLSRYKNNLDIVPVRLSQLVEIRYESADPFLAAKVANETAEAYITADLDARFNMQQTASKWLNERLEQLRGELEKSEAALQAYREEIGLVATPASSMGGNIRSMDTSAERLIAARVERTQAEQVYRQVQGNQRNRYDVPAVLNNPAVASARDAEARAQKRFTEASSSLGASHPEYKAAQAELESAQANTRRQADAVISSIAKAYEVARSAERALEKSLADSKVDIRDINRKEGRMNVLERDVQTNQQVYQAFLAKVKETDATSDFRNPIARVVDAAVPPLEPVKPPKPQIILLAALLGALLSAMLAIALEQKTAVIRNSDEVIEKLGMPLLVAVPKITGKEAAHVSRLQIDQPQSIYAEAIRSALTGVRLSLMHERHPVIAFTSTLPGEGKSTMALSYAIEQARTKKTLLIDADMRKPSIHTHLGVAGDKKGLSELFKGESYDDCIQVAPELNNLSIVFTGERVKNAHDLLMSPRFAEIIHDLKQRFELIVIDTPPLEMVSDAMPIGLQTTGVIYVVRAGETLIPMIRRSLERLQQANVPLLGIVLNAHDFHKAGRYYGEYSAYGQYGKGYKGYYGDNA